MIKSIKKIKKPHKRSQNIALPVEVNPALES